MNLLKWTSALLLLLVLAEPANAQRTRRDSSSRYGRNSSEMKDTLDDLAETAQKATCQIRDGKTNLILGTVFAKDGWIVTKSSEIQDVTDLKCVFGNDAEFSAKVIATDPSYDLALLKVQAKDLVAVKAPEKAIEVDTGQIVVSCDEDGEAMSMGLITAKPRRFSIRKRPTQPSRGFLGVVCRSSEEGLVVRTVSERSGAERAGLERGDVILTMQGKKVTTTNKLIEILTNYQPKTKIKMSVNRGDDLLDLEAVLGKRPNAGADRSDKWGGGPFSDRRFDFPPVIPHDSVIRPQQCGGPLLNSDGQVIGINIARAFRVSTYAVPIQVVTKFVDQNKSAIIPVQNQPGTELVK